VFFSELAARGRVLGVHLSDDWTDVGTPEALRAVRD
jgi:NDP-sugar pyrophosphorylase family protein